MQFLARLLSSSSRPCVAVHCSAGSARQWDRYRGLLAQPGLLLAPHLLGYADAGPLEWGHGTPLTLEDEATHLLECMPRGTRVDLVGHSYGGAVAIQLALIAPERLRSLTVYEPALFGVLEAAGIDPAASHGIETVARRVDLFAGLRRSREAAAEFVDFWGTPATWPSLTPAAQSAIAASMSKVASEFAAIRSARFRLAALRNLPFPVRFICGTESPAVSRAIFSLARRDLPKASFQSVQGAGHMGPLTHRDVLAPLLFPDLPRAEPSVIQ